MVLLRRKGHDEVFHVGECDGDTGVFYFLLARKEVKFDGFSSL